MATYKKITDLSAASALDGTELSEVVQSSVSVKATADQVAAFIASDATTLAAILAAIIPTYTTGYVNISDWSNVELTVTHGLGKNLSDLIVKFFISTDGTEANSFEVGYGHNGASNGIGFTTFNINTSSFKLQTGSNGILYVDDDGVVQLIDSENWYYKFVVYYLGA